MGNLTCRNVDTGSGHTCAGGTPTGASMIYDNEGRLISWTAPSGTTASDQFLYDAKGNRVLQRTSSTSGGNTTVTDTITFDGFTDTSITNGTASTIKYYTLAGQPIAMATSSGWYYLVPDLLGSTNVAVNGNGTVQAVQLFMPFGSARYADGTFPTAYNFTAQRLDTQTGLLYYNARYYDPVSGTFLSSDSAQGNQQGFSPYAYVNGNPETYVDPTGQDDAPTWMKVLIWLMQTYNLLLPTTNPNQDILTNNPTTQPGYTQIESLPTTPTTGSSTAQDKVLKDVQKDDEDGGKGGNNSSGSGGKGGGPMGGSDRFRSTPSQKNIKNKRGRDGSWRYQIGLNPFDRTDHHFLHGLL